MLSVKNLLNLTSDKLHTLPLLILYITDGCNSRCISCDIWQNPRRNMPLKLAESIAETCNELGVKWLLLSGGEAMQHPEWDTIARMFSEQGVHVMLLTNGLFLPKQADRVINSVDEVIVSLDGGNASTYEKIRGVDAFDLILEGIDNIKSAGIPVTTRTTVQKLNFREILQIVDVGLQHNIDNISFLAVDISNPFAFGIRDTEASSGALSLSDIDELEKIISTMEITHADAFENKQITESPQKLHRILVQYFRNLQSVAEFERPRCNAPHFSTVIEVDGQLRPCYFLPAYGRLQPQGERLTEAINWDAARDLRRAYRKGERTECKTCVCPLYKGPRALMRM